MFNFDLRASDFDPTGRRPRVAVSDSPAGEAEPVQTAAPPIDLEDALQLDRAGLAALGATFTAALLPPPLWATWRESVGRAQGQGLRLRVRTADAACAALPWELLYDEERAAFLALDPATPLVRYPEGPIPHPAPEPPQPLRLLLASALPTGITPLAVARELDQVQAALAPAVAQGQIALRRLDHLQSHRLQSHLLEQRPHVLHFAGHGLWEGDAEQGHLVLEDERGEPDPFATDILATLLRSRDVRLAVLNACETAAGGAARWSGVARSLVRAGVPAVVAMRASITDRAAVAFADIFYTAIAAGEPVDRAITHGRQAILRCAGPGAAGAWLIPTLFLRTDDGHLWTPPPPASRQEETAPGGISIGSIQAQNVVIGDQTVNVTGRAP